MKKTIIVVGAGKGLGNRVAEKFGMNNFRVILTARNAGRLAEYKKEFEEKGVEVYVKTVDASKPHSITKAFCELKAEFGSPDVLFYNVGVTEPDKDLTEAKDVDLLMKRYQADVAGAYHSIQQVLDEEFCKKHGAILITGGGLALSPMDEYLPLSMDKAALRAMCVALHNKLKEQNVFVGTLIVTDEIKPGGKCDPSLLADDFWKLYTERKECEAFR